MSSAKMKLSDVSTLIVDDDRSVVTILTQMMDGLGLEMPTIAKSGAAAQELLRNHTYDLCICEARLPDMGADVLVRWIRQIKTPQRFVPILVLTGYSNLRNIFAMRDAGANLVVKKPVSPRVLYDHVEWCAKSSRPFVETVTYAGPDRRFRSIDPPQGEGRRETDFPTKAGGEPRIPQAEYIAPHAKVSAP